ncbi:hypothetical protein D3C72_2338740 [compost metagenome]
MIPSYGLTAPLSVKLDFLILQKILCRLGILADLRDESVDRVELALRTDKLNEFHRHLPAVHISGEME